MPVTDRLQFEGHLNGPAITPGEIRMCTNQHRLFFVFALSILLGLPAAAVVGTPTLEIGAPAPDFSLPADYPGDYDGFVKNLHAVKTRYYTQMLSEGHIPLRPGIKQLMADARSRGIRLAIATTTTPENVTALLQPALGADGESWFEVIGCGDIVPHKKPAPDIYFWVLEKMGLSAADCIALEDSENGLHSSLAAGIKTFVTINQYTRNQNFNGAEAVFDDLSDLSNFYRAAGLPFHKQQISA